MAFVIKDFIGSDPTSLKADGFVVPIGIGPIELGSTLSQLDTLLGTTHIDVLPATSLRLAGDIYVTQHYDIATAFIIDDHRIELRHLLTNSLRRLNRELQPGSMVVIAPFQARLVTYGYTPAVRLVKDMAEALTTVNAHSSDELTNIAVVTAAFNTASFPSRIRNMVGQVFQQAIAER